MGEIVLKDGAQTPKKKRGMPGFLKFLIIFISVIIGLALILVVTAFICFYDNGHKDIPVKADYETSEVFNEVMVDSLDNAKANKKITFALAEDQLNQIIYNAFKDKEEAKEYLKNFYVEVNDGKFDFVAEVSALNFVKTRLTIGTELEVDENTMVFKVTNVRVGKINHLQGLVNVITQYISLPDFNEALASAGLHMNLDIKKLTITYDLDDFYNDILHLMGDGDSDYMTIFKEIINQDSLRTISSTGKNIFALDVDLAKLAVDETTVGITGYQAPNGYFDMITPGVINDVKALLNNNTVSEDNAQTVANYFLGGDTLLSDSEKAVVNAYKESITSFAAYTSSRYDYTADPSESLKAKVEEQITKPIPSISETIQISTDDLDSMFSTSPALGRFSLFLRDVNKGISATKNYKINYVNISRISTAFKNNNMFIILSINFNGQAGNITLKCEKQTADAGFGALKLNISDLYLGNIKVSEETKDTFVDFISDAMGNDSFDSVFSINNGVLTINLKNILDENNVMEEFGYQTSFAFHANTKDEAGGLIIHADR